MIGVISILIILLIYINILDGMFPDRDEFYQIVDSCDYFNSLNKYDLYHRGCDHHEQYILLYKSSYIPLNYYEKSLIYLQSCMLNLPKKLRIKYKIVRVKFDKLLEMSFPHTINNVIILNDRYFTDDYDQQCNTLIHELLHIYQRIYPNDIERLINKMGFYKINNNQKQLIDELNLPIANSSDMNDVYYCIINDNIYILHMIYKNYELHDICIDQYGNITYVDFNSMLSQQGHPYEITAEVISRLLTNTYVVRKDWQYLINEWFNEIVLS